MFEKYRKNLFAKVKNKSEMTKLVSKSRKNYLPDKEN